MLKSSKLSQPWILSPCSFARCSNDIKHKCGEMSLSDAAALQSSGNVAKVCLKEIVFPCAFEEGKTRYLCKELKIQIHCKNKTMAM